MYLLILDSFLWFEAPSDFSFQNIWCLEALSEVNLALAHLTIFILLVQ